MKGRLALIAAAALLALPATAAAAAPLEIRHVELKTFPQVRVTVFAPAGARPVLFENGRGAAFAKARRLGSSEALVLAVDNSESMSGRPLREAKQAAKQFLAAQSRRASAFGLVAFGHEALPLSGRNASGADVAQTLSALAPDALPGTALYDAVVSSVGRLRHLSAATRILVLLTDGRDVGSRASLRDAVAAAQAADVTVYAIAAGARADRHTLAALTDATGGRVFGATDVSQLAAIYAALGRELEQTWQLTYLTRGRPGDPLNLRVRADAASSQVHLRVPGSAPASGGPIPAHLARKQDVLYAVVALAALLLAIAGARLIRGRRKPEIRRLLDPHVQRTEQRAAKERKPTLDPLFDWTEDALADLPGHEWLRLSLGLACALVFGVFGLVISVEPLLSLVLLLLGFLTPLIALRIAAGRRSKAFDRQLPDMLSTIASTLRAGHGLRTALRSVADDGSPPASEELMRVLGEERLGRPLDDGINAMCKRIGSEDMEYVATAINVQAQAGGSLATLFDTLSETVRERQRHARKVRALTSMGRMSATILTCLPFGLAALMTMISPKYMSPFLKTSTGHVLIAFCIVSMTIGALVLKRIVNVRY
jgi:tight adherence protein B